MLKEIFSDFVLLYKNFFHWNVSKVLIYISAALFALFLALPFFATALIIGFYDPVNWQEIFGYYSQAGRLPITFVETIKLHSVNVFINSLLILLGFGMLFVGWMQYLLTSAKLYLGYIDGEKIGVFSNIYFNFKYLKKLTAYLAWLALVLIVPILVFIVIMAVGILFAFGPHSSLDTFFPGIVIGVSFFVCFVLFLYFTFRYGYGYLAIVDTKNYPELHSGKFYLKESKKLTQNNMWKLIGISLLFAICLYLPIEIVNYIVSEILKNDVITIVWVIIAFLFFSLSYEMLFTSMYRRILLKNNKSVISEEKQAEEIL